MARTPEVDKYKYILDWIKESTDARRAQNALVERTIKAYQGEPTVNYYKKSMNKYAAALQASDPEKAKQLQDYANDIPDKGSDVIENAVEAVVSMCMGGVGRFEFGPYDPDMAKDDDVIDMLGSAAKHFYVTNKIDSVVPQYIRGSVLAGSSTIILRQKNKKMTSVILGSDQMLFDPKRVKTNCERFIGFTQRESWAAVRARTVKTKGGYMLKSINETDQYIDAVVKELNGVQSPDPQSSFNHETITKDIDTFYSALWLQYGGAAGQNGAITDPAKMYAGDEIEMTYLYDLQSDLYFEIVNRKYITVGKPNPLVRRIKATYYDFDGKPHDVNKEIKLDHPFIELPYKKTLWDTYPVTPLFRRLEDFDNLCAMESLLYHNTSVSAALTFIGQSSDGQKVARASGIAGEIIDGMPQTFGVLNKNHDETNLLGLIKRYEDRIKRSINATDQFQMQGMIGDRATAKEVMAAQGQVSQGLNPFIANIETAMATMGDKFLKLQLILNDGSYSFVHNGKYAELAPEDMAGDYEVQAKLVSSIKLEQEAQARKALEVVQYTAQLESIDKKTMFGILLPIILTSVVNREQAESMVLPQYRIMPAHPVEDETAEPITDEELEKMSPEELDALIEQITKVHADDKAYFDPTMNGNPGNPGGSVMDPANPGMSVDPNQAAAVAATQQDPSTAVPPATDPSVGLPQTNSSVEGAGAQAGAPEGAVYGV